MVLNSGLPNPRHDGRLRENHNIPTAAKKLTLPPTSFAHSAVNLHRQKPLTPARHSLARNPLLLSIQLEHIRNVHKVRKCLLYHGQIRKQLIDGLRPILPHIYAILFETEQHQRRQPRRQRRRGRVSAVAALGLFLGQHELPREQVRVVIAQVSLRAVVPVRGADGDGVAPAAREIWVARLACPFRVARRAAHDDVAARGVRDGRLQGFDVLVLGVLLDVPAHGDDFDALVCGPFDCLGGRISESSGRRMERKTE
jgi:hypothetical protein